MKRDVEHALKIRKCVTIEEDLLKWIEQNIKTGKFASYSHGFEYCIRETMKKEKPKP